MEYATPELRRLVDRVRTSGEIVGRPFIPKDTLKMLDKYHGHVDFFRVRLQLPKLTIHPEGTAVYDLPAASSYF